MLDRPSLRIPLNIRHYYATDNDYKNEEECDVNTDIAYGIQTATPNFVSSMIEHIGDDKGYQAC